MLKIKAIIFCMLIILNFYIALHAQEFIVASLNKDNAYIGDVLEFTVKVELPKDAQIAANQNFKLEDFEISKVNIKRLPKSSNVYELIFEIYAYKAGHLIIEPLTIFYINPDGTNNLFFTPEKSVDIKSLITDSKNPNIKDIKNLKKISISIIFIVPIIILLIFIIILSMHVIKNIREQMEKAKIVILDDKTIALNTLNDLYQNRTNLNIRDFYYKMSEILRTYMSKQYKFDAMEMTTSEFFEKVKELLPSEININEFKRYLQIFNLARYADFTPTEKKVEDNYLFTKKLLELI
ncbi:MAG: hypothetical protein LBS38_01800 [Endomicrobium sp.]|jgi:hypothetical protein|nr:hypothetical protein [Endomicrobium sp.]